MAARRISAFRPAGRRPRRTPRPARSATAAGHALASSRSRASRSARRRGDGSSSVARLRSGSSRESRRTRLRASRRSPLDASRRNGRPRSARNAQDVRRAKRESSGRTTPSSRRSRGPGQKRESAAALLREQMRLEDVVFLVGGCDAVRARLGRPSRGAPRSGRAGRPPRARGGAPGKPRARRVGGTAKGRAEPAGVVFDEPQVPVRLAAAPAVVDVGRRQSRQPGSGARPPPRRGAAPSSRRPRKRPGGGAVPRGVSPERPPIEGRPDGGHALSWYRPQRLGPSVPYLSEHRRLHVRLGDCWPRVLVLGRPAGASAQPSVPRPVARAVRRRLESTWRSHGAPAYLGGRGAPGRIVFSRRPGLCGPREPRPGQRDHRLRHRIGLEGADGRGHHAARRAGKGPARRPDPRLRSRRSRTRARRSPSGT